jgi:uncharacterized membrane protein
VSAAELREMGAAGILPKPAVARSLALAGASPTEAEWRRFLSRLLVFLGTGLVLAGVIYFFAYNWNRIDRYFKFGLIELSIATTSYLAWRRGAQRLSGQVLITTSAVLLGPLLAVYGQTYQTGADPYGLFLAWGALILPWAFWADFAPLWLMALGLFNTAAALYWDGVRNWFDMEHTGALGLGLFGLNALAWALWDGLRVAGQRPELRWFPRVAATAAMGALALPSLIWIVDPQEHPLEGLACGLFVAAQMGAAVFYRLRGRDLFMLALVASGAMALATTVLGRLLLEGHSDPWGGILLLGMAVVGQVAGAAWWLRGVHRAFQGAEVPLADVR